MKKIIIVALVAIFSFGSVFEAAACMKHVAIPFSLIHTDGALKQFRKASAANQREVINEFIRQAEEEYRQDKTIDDLEALRVQVDFINVYVDKYRWAFMGMRKHYMLSERMRTDMLYKKIVAKICELRGGVMIFTETGEYLDPARKR